MQVSILKLNTPFKGTDTLSLSHCTVQTITATKPALTWYLRHNTHTRLKVFQLRVYGLTKEIDTLYDVNNLIS